MTIKENEQMENNTPEEKEKGAVGKSTVLIILLLLLLLLVGVVLVVLLLRKTPEGVVLDPNSGKYEAPIDVPENYEQNYISLPGYSNLYVMAGEDTTNVALWNPESNPCYFKYTIRLQDTDEVIYESGMIAPGDAVTGAKLDRTFSKGVYPVVISITTYALDDYEQQLNGGEIETQLIATATVEEQE